MCASPFSRTCLTRQESQFLVNQFMGLLHYTKDSIIARAIKAEGPISRLNISFQCSSSLTTQNLVHCFRSSRESIKIYKRPSFFHNFFIHQQLSFLLFYHPFAYQVLRKFMCGHFTMKNCFFACSSCRFSRFKSMCISITS